MQVGTFPPPGMKESEAIAQLATSTLPASI